ncbi:LysM peptidoglycan-binding domain-containing protein [Streptomyces albireticuli]|uniref:Transglycosylase n=1 Tax=Streptomyces albireticuli TaxID=1940 RepID=A0A2A2D0K2_9ACTN|nr:transglycosylase family protein [Streptomyces albireticuli]MCD9144533.1 LysM peptidoglycan-binding domain-containing protein [Streptomyces albireticuli]MCD9163404.1 LysM peptidoglycan-binding domain-containing protein [Streptomyces albireticuli]MCD9193210.1 LysM peptidoglycan-binding domain-containing protein [Streptomyces albireticuli]PAU44862.1 transglycosylase [Streptomyces albireticuli]
MSKGKHRRPSKAVRIVTLAGVTGAAVAAPLMIATSANAASVSTWDKVAQCESSGDWSINNGNGYYGGLQFSKSSWDAAGGGQYAAYPHQATKSQQIAVAEKLLAMQGPGAWGCAGPGGLTAGGPKADVDTSGSGSTTKSSRGTSTKSHADRSERQAAPKRTTPKQSAPKYVAPQADDQDEAPAPKPAAPKHSASGSFKKGDGEYQVKEGDTLAKIAETQKVKGGWQELHKLNKDVVEDADLIFVGQQLHLR